DISGELSLDYSYTRDLLFDRPEEKSSGKGYSIDLEVAGQFINNLHYQLQLFDMFNRFYWSDQTYTHAEAKSDKPLGGIQIQERRTFY
ncbi:MAG: hypothetical protein QMC69_06455, partial [Gammaproteobacteria bacterium]